MRLKSMRIKLHIFLCFLPIITLVGGLIAMPQDSNTYFYTTKPTPISKCSYTNYLTLPSSGLTSSTVSDFQLTVFSDPLNGKVDVDAFNKMGEQGDRIGRGRVNHDRGGDAFLKFSTNQILVYTNPGCTPFTGTTYSGYFDHPFFINSDKWLNLSYSTPGNSVSTVSQPFAIKTKVIPLGHRSGKIFQAIPFDDFGIQIRKVINFRALGQNDPNTTLPFQLSSGDRASYDLQGPGFTTRGMSSYFNEAANAFILASGANDDINPSNSVNRGYIQAQYIAASCSDGYGAFNAFNVGSRSLAAADYKYPFSILTSYTGCNGTRNGIYVIENTGDDIWGTSDNFRYVYKSGTGNRTLQVRVDQLENTGPWARAGLMIRTGTGAADYNIGLFVTPSNGLIFQRRLSTTAGNSASSGTVAGIKAPIWLQLVYNNASQLTTAWYGSDTSPWIQIGTGVAGAFGSYTFGLAAASRSSVPNTSVYSNLNF